MKKGIVSVLVAVCVVSGVFASGAKESAAEPSTIMYMSTSWGAPSQELLAEFTKQTGTTVQVSTMKETALRDKVMTAAAGKVNPADVIFVGISYFGPLASSGILSALDDTTWKSTLDSVYGASFYRIDGKQLAIPLYQQMVMIDFDKAGLQKIGKTAADLRTWSDFEAAAQALKANGTYQYPIAFGMRSWSWYLIALSSGSRLFDAQMNPTFTDKSSPGYQAFDTLVRFYKEGLISPERLTSQNPHPQFWAGQAEFHQAWQGSLSISNDPKQSKVAPNADYLLLPGKHFTWSLPGGAGISAYTKAPKAAAKFIQFMLSDQVERYAYSANGMFPANSATFKGLGDEGKIEGWPTMQEQAKYLVSLPYEQPWFDQFDAEATAALVRVARGQQTVDQAIQGLGEYQQKLKKEYQ